MSLDLIAKHKGNSDIADGMLEIIRQLGLWLEAITGVNPDAGYSSFSAANYNHGNRSEQADLIEEVILRLEQINAAGPGSGGGGKPEDKKIRVDADDTVSKTFDELIDPLLNEISWGKSDGTEELGKQIILIAKLAFLAGQKAYVGGVSASDPSEHAKLNVLAEENQRVVVLETFSGKKLIFNDKGVLLYRGGSNFQIDVTGLFSITNAGTEILSGDTTKLVAQSIKQTVHTTPAAVNADVLIASKEVVALADGLLVRKL